MCSWQGAGLPRFRACPQRRRCIRPQAMQCHAPRARGCSSVPATRPPACRPTGWCGPWAHTGNSPGAFEPPAERLDQRSGLQFVLHQAGGHDAHAEAGHRGADDERVEIEARPEAAAGRVALVRLHPVVPGERHLDVLQQRGVLQVLRRAQPQRVAQLGAADDAGLLADQVAGIGTGPVAVAVLDGGVEFMRHREIVRMLVAHEVERHLGQGALEVAQPREQPLCREGRRHREIERAAAAAVRHELRRRRLQRRHRGAGGVEVGGAGVRQLQPARLADEEPLSQVILQRRDVAADGALGHAQFARCHGEGMVLCRGVESVQFGNGRAEAAHRAYEYHSWSGEVLGVAAGVALAR